jgi:hypothetical protein
MKISGKFHVQHIRNGEIIAEFDIPNGATLVGKNLLLNNGFRAGTGPSWYIGLINGTSATLAEADTMASHAGWTENTSYDESARQTWSPDEATNKILTNSTPAVFTMSATGNVYGLFVTTNSTKGGTTGTLWATAAFASPRAVADNDVLNVTYSTFLD